MPTEIAVDIDQDSLIRDLTAMVRIPSVNPFGSGDDQATAEAGMADYFEHRLQDLGLEVSSREVLPGRRNVWGVLKGSGNGPTVLLAGHLDTVGVDGYDDPFHANLQDGKIHGRGSCDMKAGLAAYLEVIRLLRARADPLQGDVVVAGVIDEEHAMAGSRDFGLNGPPVDFAIVAEPTQLDICPAHKGQILMTITTHGVAAHSSIPQNGTNAIYHMGAVLGALQGYADQLAKTTPDPICGTPSFSVGVIRGGDNACSVPDFCEIDIDRRTIPGENHADVIAELAAIMDAVGQKIPGFHYEFAPPFLDLPPLATQMSDPVVRAVTQACKTVTGRSNHFAFPGSSDAPNFRCSTVICGPGSLEQCHSLNEFVALSEIEKAIEIYLHSVLTLQSR